MAAHIGAPARPQPLVAARSRSTNDAEELCALLRAARTAWPASTGAEPAPYAPILKAVEKARKDLRQRKAGAVYAKLLRELDAPHVLLRAPRRNSTPTTKATLTSTPGRSAALRRGGRAAYVPSFLMNLLDLADCPATRLFLARPECFLFESDFLLMPNPAYYDYDAAVQSPASYARKVLRRGLGFGLVAWFVHPELRKRARFFRCHPDLRVASRLIGEAAPPSPLPSPRRGVPSPPSTPTGRPRTGSYDYTMKPPPPAPILLGSPSFVARRAAASPRAPSPRNAPASPTARAAASQRVPRNAPATPTTAARPPAPEATPAKLVEAPVYVGDVLGSSADAVPYLYDDSDLRPEHASKLEALETGIRLHVRTTYGHVAARALRADGIYFHRQHALYSEPDRAWTFTAHAHVAIGRARTPACYCHSATLGDVVARLRAPPSAATPPLELLNMPRDADALAEARRRLVDAGFWVSRTLSPQDLAFEDLLEAATRAPLV